MCLLLSNPQESNPSRRDATMSVPLPEHSDKTRFFPSGLAIDLH
jgi:hypothetical protein